MPPKFQSSFIPKGPVASAGIPNTRIKAPVQRDLLSIISKWFFGISVVMAVVATGYKFYLDYSIDNMTIAIEEARAQIAGDALDELTSLNDRMVSAENLIKNHRIATPLFASIEDLTPRGVRLTEFNFEMGDKGPEVSWSGESNSYANLSRHAEAVYADKNFKDPSFSDIKLNERGSVTFSFKASINREILSYERAIAGENVSSTTASSTAPAVNATSTPVTGATATSTNATSTTN